MRLKHGSSDSLLRTSRAALAWIVVIVAMSTAPPLHAELISGTLFTPGDGLVTIETETGYAWIDLRATEPFPQVGPPAPYNSVSYNSMQSALQSGAYDIGGNSSRRPRYATIDELFEFHENAGMHPGLTRRKDEKGASLTHCISCVDLLAHIRWYRYDLIQKRCSIQYGLVSWEDAGT